AASILVVVVLPAPLRPRNPKMDPCGTRRFSPRSASVASKRFRRSTVSMASGSDTPSSCLGQPGELCFEQSPDLFVGQPALTQPLDRGGHDGLRRPQTVGRL